MSTCCPCYKKPEGFRRINGLQTPYHPLQLLTWSLFPILNVHYYAFLYPLLWSFVAVKVIITLLFVGSSIWMLYGTYMCCSIDPVDDALVNKPATYSGEDLLFCYECEATVDRTSKHCRYCNKWYVLHHIISHILLRAFSHIFSPSLLRSVLGLDHHCVWLNTCIGSKNYPYFLHTVGAVGTSFITQY